jgi:hypothetical protein
MKLFLILGLCAATLAACAAPGLRLRDDYMGRQLLEPNLGPAPVQHDAQGNAIAVPPPRADFPVYRN